MTEDNIQQNEEAVSSQTDKQNQSVLEDSDYKAMLLEETQQSKKYRKRAQKAEAKILEYQKQQEKDKIAAMKENEQYKELSEDLQSKLDNALPYKERWKAYEQARREEYLSQLPEEDRETMASKDIETLEYIIKMKNSSKPDNPRHQPNASRNVAIANKPYNEMTNEERKKWHEDFLNQN